jgi:hypothetical protein
MLIKLTNKNNNVFLLETNYIYEIGPVKEDSEGNALVFSTMTDDNRQRIKYVVLETVDGIIKQIEKREKSSK